LVPICGSYQFVGPHTHTLCIQAVESDRRSPQQPLRQATVIKWVTHQTRHTDRETKAEINTLFERSDGRGAGERARVKRESAEIQVLGWTIRGIVAQFFPVTVIKLEIQRVHRLVDQSECLKQIVRTKRRRRGCQKSESKERRVQKSKSSAERSGES